MSNEKPLTKSEAFVEIHKVAGYCYNKGYNECLKHVAIGAGIGSLLLVVVIASIERRKLDIKTN